MCVDGCEDVDCVLLVVVVVFGVEYYVVDWEIVDVDDLGWCVGFGFWIDLVLVEIGDYCVGVGIGVSGCGCGYCRIYDWCEGVLERFVDCLLDCRYVYVFDFVLGVVEVVG